MITKRKVLAYITNQDGATCKLLVFEHKDQPEAGLQVPGGTIEKDEEVIDALYREIFEESGIEKEELIFERKLLEYHYSPKNKETIYERHIFHLTYLGDKEAWNHVVVGDGNDNGLIFRFRWELIDSLPTLAGEQDVAVALLKKTV